MHAFIVICLLFMSTSASAAAWKWWIDGSPSSIEFADGHVRFKSALQSLSFRNRRCNQYLLKQFKDQFKRHINDIEVVKNPPNDAQPIEVYFEGNKRLVYRGTRTGLFLLRFAGKVEQLKIMENLRCR